MGQNLSQTEQNLFKFVVNLMAFGKQRGKVELISRYFPNTVAHKLKPTGEKKMQVFAAGGICERRLRSNFVFEL